MIGIRSGNCIQYRELSWLDSLAVYFLCQEKSFDLYSYSPQFEDCESESHDLFIHVETKIVGQPTFDASRNVFVHPCKRERVFE